MSIYKNHPDFIPVDKEPSKAPFSFCSRKAETEKPEINPDWHSGRPSRGRVSDGETYRLVKASKSPTPPKPPVTGEYFEYSVAKTVEKEPAQNRPASEGAPGVYAVIQYREWSDEYRIRSQVRGACQSPPEQSGARITDKLSRSAARKIAESCAYVAKAYRGYSTFLTLTFTDEQRFSLEASGPYCQVNTREEKKPVTIQKEVSRFCDGLTKMYQRGWRAESTVHGRRYACIGREGKPLGEEPRQDQPFLYVWVAEVPDNEKGEPNPHVHMLIRWRVHYELFPSWAKRIETLWGQGLAHLEKIKDGEAAAAYMMKAAGYMTKAQGKTDQGKVRGNRYGISSEARAPEWVTIEENQLHAMGMLIADVNDHITARYGALYSERKRLNAQLDRTPKGTRQRKQIGRKLQNVRKTLNNLPVVASRYQIILRGKEAFYEFMNWVLSPGHWLATVCPWLPEKWPGEQWIRGKRPESMWLAEFRKRHYWRRAERNMPEPMSDEEWKTLLDLATEKICS